MIDAFLDAVVRRGSAFGEIFRESGGPPLTRVEAAALEEDAAGKPILCVTFNFAEDGRRFEFRTTDASEVLEEFERGEEDADGAALLIVIELFEALEATGLERSLADGAIRELT